MCLPDGRGVKAFHTGQNYEEPVLGFSKSAIATLGRQQAEDLGVYGSGMYMEADRGTPANIAGPKAT